MQLLTDSPYIDIIVVVIANVINLGMVAIFLVRTQGKPQLERRIGRLQIMLALPLFTAVVYNTIKQRPWWTLVLPALLVAFLVIELVLDYILNANFRRMRLLGPYLLLYYVALTGMIGYAFLTHELLGFVTLVTYYAQLGATAYSYRKVGHGIGSPNSPAFNQGHT